MPDQLKTIMAEILSLAPDEITEESSMENIENWDSLSHLHLISKLEETFKIKIEPEEILNLTSFSAIKILLQKKDVCFL